MPLVTLEMVMAAPEPVRRSFVDILGNNLVKSFDEIQDGFNTVGQVFQARTAAQG
jgi:hypothetical protein